MNAQTATVASPDDGHMSTHDPHIDSGLEKGHGEDRISHGRGIGALPHAKLVRQQISAARLKAFSIITKPAVDEFENEIFNMINALMQALSTDDPSDDQEVDLNFGLERGSRGLFSWRISKRNKRLQTTIDRLFSELEKQPDLFEELRANYNGLNGDLTLRNVFLPIQDKVKEKGFRLEVIKYGDTGCPIEFELYIYENPLKKWTTEQVKGITRFVLKLVTTPVVVYNHLTK